MDTRPPSQMRTGPGCNTCRPDGPDGGTTRTLDAAGKRSWLAGPRQAGRIRDRWPASRVRNVLMPASARRGTFASLLPAWAGPSTTKNRPVSARGAGNSPKRRPTRLSTTFPSIQAAPRDLDLASGEEKAGQDRGCWHPGGYRARDFPPAGACRGRPGQTEGDAIPDRPPRGDRRQTPGQASPLSHSLTSTPVAGAKSERPREGGQEGRDGGRPAEHVSGAEPGPSCRHARSAGAPTATAARPKEATAAPACQGQRPPVRRARVSSAEQRHRADRRSGLIENVSSI